MSSQGKTITGEGATGTASSPSPITGVHAPPRVRQKTLLTTVIAVAAAVVVVGAAFVLTDGFGLARGSSVTTLIPYHDYYSLAGGQFNAVAFQAHQASKINGTFTNSNGVTVYMMTPSELEYLAVKAVVNGYTWTSGRIANLTNYNLDISVASGEWDLVFLNPDPDPLNTSVVGFYTAVTLSPG